jgi:hypothetical protein
MPSVKSARDYIPSRCRERSYNYFARRGALQQLLLVFCDGVNYAIVFEEDYISLVLPA